MSYSLVDLVNRDHAISAMGMYSPENFVVTELPVLATPATVTVAAAWVTANKAAVAGATAFGALFGAGVWAGVANAK